MSLLSPWGLLWLGGIPVLIWLWRFAASRRQIILPSLVPFERLVRRPPTRRTQLLVNLLFWLQLAAIALIALALAEPGIVTARIRTVLVLIDTSASMAATTGGPSPFQQAKRSLLARAARKRPNEQFFLIRTAPVDRVTDRPVSDAVQLRQLIDRLATTELAGNLSIARRVGEALLAAPPDELIVLTDEPQPARLDPAVAFHAFAAPLPNVAIVGLDAHESLCAPTEASVLATVQNAADAPQTVALAVRDNGRVVATASHALDPHSRTPITVAVPPAATGLLEVVLSAPTDALAVDNRALVVLRGAAPLPVLVASDRADFIHTIGGWLEACPQLAWKPMSLSADGPLHAVAGAQGSADALLITDHPELMTAWPTEAIVFVQQPGSQPVAVTQWLVDSVHPLGEYLQPLEAVSAAVTRSPSIPSWGDPVIWGVVHGERVPLVQAASRQGRRTVAILADPVASPTAVPLVMVFLNGLRWITGSVGLVTTGEPLLVGPFDAGVVSVHRPGGAVELVPHAGGLFRYDATDRVGRYRFMQGRVTAERIVNFLDPVESDTMRRLSTFESAPPAAAASVSREPPRHSLVTGLLGLLVAVLLLEWVLYGRKGRVP